MTTKRGYTIHFRNGEVVSGVIEWADPACLEDLLLELGLTAADAKRILRVERRMIGYQAFADTERKAA